MVEEFYDELHYAVNNATSTDVSIIMRDFNANVGRNTDNWHGTIVKFGFGERNIRGEQLLNFNFASNGLFITNTCFKQRKNQENGHGNHLMARSTT